MINQGNDSLFSRILDVLKHFATRDELDQKLSEQFAKCAKQEDLLELKDDMAHVKTDLHNLTTFSAGYQKRTDQDLVLVKAKLGLV